MKKYFYAIGTSKEGPLTIEELKLKNISPKTLIWHEGLENWQEAQSLEELTDVIIFEPPPINEIDNLELNFEDTTNQNIKSNSYQLK